MVIFNLQLKGSLDARRRQGEQERTSERDEGGRGGRLALGAPGTTEGDKKKCHAHHPERAGMHAIAGACILCRWRS